MANKHGVFIQEEATAITIPKVADGSLVVIGTAPVNMVENPDAVTNVPILANTAAEAMAELGFVNDPAYTLCQAMNVLSNVYPVSPAVFINVLDHQKHKKEYKATIPVTDLQGTLEKSGILLDTVKVTRSSAGADDEPMPAETADINDLSKEFNGVKYSGMVARGAKILPDGSVSGVFYYVKSYTGFSSAVDEQNGYYLPLLLGSEYDGKDITVQRTSGKKGTEKKIQDKEWVLRISDEAETVYTIKADGMPDLVLNFKHARFLKDGEGVDLIADEDYILAFDDDGYLAVTMIDGGHGAEEPYVQIEADMIDPSMVDKDDIIGKYDVTTGRETGMEVIRQIYPKLGIVPGILIAPGYSHIPEVGIALMAKAANINGVFKAMAFLDISTEEDGGARKYTDVKEAKEKSGYTSEFCYNLWPCVKVGDAVYPFSLIAAARTMDNDADNDGVPSASPSNKELAITGTCLADGTEVVLDQDQATAVGEYGVATATNINGFRMWGNHTGAWPASGDAKDVWINVRRMFNWQGNTFILTYFSKVDDPMNYVLIENIVDSENIRCAAYAPTHWAGASIEYLEADNPITDILAGRMTFRQHIAPYTPAETITNILNYDTEMLQAALTGGE